MFNIHCTGTYQNQPEFPITLTVLQAPFFLCRPNTGFSGILSPADITAPGKMSFWPSLDGLNQELWEKLTP